MIITCEKCSTQFKLDDARIPERGVRVRCSRCKHAFHVDRPPTGERRIERAVEHVLDADTQELDSTAPPGDEESPFEESDWEFNTDGPRAASESDAEPDPEPGPEGGEEVEHRIGAPLGEGESLALAGEDEAAPDLDAGPAPEAAEEDLGRPEDWDFSAEEEQDGGTIAPAAPAPARAGIAIGQLGIAPTVERLALPAEAESTPSRLGVWSGRVFDGIGWIAVLGLALAALAGGLSEPARSAPAAGASQRVGALEAREIEGHWVDNAVAGPILVVSGELTGGERVAPGAWVAVRLLDRHGAVVADAAAAAGPALPEERLREDDPRQLRAVQASRARAMAAAPLGALASRRFQAIVSPVPPEAARFDLVAVPPEPAAEPLP